MTIHKEGTPSILIALLFVSLVSWLTHYLAGGFNWFVGLMWVLSAAFFFIIVYFFRSPNRKITPDDNQVLSPADGKVVVIEEVREEEYFNDPRIQVSVFMSPLNVHLNRYPVGGKLDYFKYHPGHYHVAWHPKSSTENERTTIVVETTNGPKVLFRQIAGAMARRIVSYCEEGNQVSQGEECGFIKFGSRVDILLPLDAKVKVAIGDKVKGAQSIIAELA